MTSQASAGVSCWSTWDPFACALQKWFGNGNTQSQRGINIKLPDPKSEEYKKVAAMLKEGGKFGNEAAPKRGTPVNVVQTCSSKQLLAVIAKSQSVKTSAEKCFKVSKVEKAAPSIKNKAKPQAMKMQPAKK